MLKFIIFRVLFEGCYRYTIIQLRTEGVNRVVDDQDIFKGHILEDAQIFYVHVVSGLDTRFAVEPVLDELAGWVYVV